MKIVKIMLNAKRDVYMTAYLQDVGGEFSNLQARPAMIVLPGGGYAACSERESDPVALAYAKAGFQTFILHYTVLDKGGWPMPLQDYNTAVAEICAHEKEWHIYKDKICCVGFSAGGHLAAMAAANAEKRPAVAVLGYPAIHCMPYVPKAEEYVDKNTSPCFVFGTRTDFLNPTNILDFLSKLTQNDISFESHIYSYGPHGYSTGEHCVQPYGTAITPRATGWVNDSIGFIKEVIGDFAEGKMTEPVVKKHVNGNHEENLSIRCTLAHLLCRADAIQVIEPVIAAIRSKIPGAACFGMEEENEKTRFVCTILKAYSLQDILHILKFSQAQIEIFEQKLNDIPNS